MTIERLEEIAAWAEEQSKFAERFGFTDRTVANYADLARCVHEWAKLERLKREYDRYRRQEGLGPFLGIGGNMGAERKSIMQLVSEAHTPPVKAHGGAK